MQLIYTQLVNKDTDYMMKQNIPQQKLCKL